MSASPFHAGERAAQARMGLGDSVERYARQVVRSYMPEQHRSFFESLPFIVVAARDRAGRPWGTLLSGTPGFIRTASATTLNIDARISAEDPLAETIGETTDVGMLGIELDSRRRNRVNGVLSTNEDGTLSFETTQSFGNCPQHISVRQWVAADDAHTASTVRRGHRLDADQQRWITLADTFFIASGYGDSNDDVTHGMDASHRGGPAGFVEVIDANTLRFPDYAGNNHFNTIGNLLKDARVGLTFVDFDHGHLLHLTGRAEIDWAPEQVTAGIAAQRRVTVRIDETVEQRDALPIRWETPATHPLSLRVIDRIDESSEVISFRLASADGTPLPTFRAGQHLPIALPHAPDATQRTYSLSSAPDESTYRISVKRDGVVSSYLHDHVFKGDCIRAQQPAGDFVLEDSTEPVVLVSAGVGVTPMLSILRSMVRDGDRRAVYFIYGVRSERDWAFAEELRALVKDRPWIDLTLLVSQPSATLRGQSRAGRVGADIVAERHPRLSGNFYLCGPTPMIGDVFEGLVQRGVSEDRIHIESFGSTG